MKLQTKQLALNHVELKADGKELFFAGYASKFNLTDSYGDTVEKGAYKNTIKNRERPIRMRFNHYSEVIGKWTRIEEDEKGLYVEGELTPGHSKAQDVYASLKHGAVDGLSIGYRVKSSENLSDGRRLLKEIDLVEISVVEDPADLGAQIGEVKSRIEECTDLKDCETILRDAGLTRAEATALVSRIKSIGQSDSVHEQQKQALKNMFSEFTLKEK